MADLLLLDQVMEQACEPLGVDWDSVDHLIKHVVVDKIGLNVGDCVLTTPIGHAKDKLLGLLIPLDVVVRDVGDVYFVQHVVVRFQNDLVPIFEYPHLPNPVFVVIFRFFRVIELEKCWCEG